MTTPITMHDKEEYSRLLIFKKNNGVGLVYTCRSFTSEPSFLRIYTILKQQVYIPIQDIEYMKVLSEGLISDLKIDLDKKSWGSK